MLKKVSKTTQFTLLAIVSCIGLVFCLRTQNNLVGSGIKERILSSGTYSSTIGGYTIVDTSKVTAACGTTSVRDV